MKNRKLSLSNFILYIMIFIFIAPLIILVVWSFAKNWPWPNIVPSSLGLRGWKYFLDPTSKSFKILGFSICLSMVTTLITVLISIPAGKALGFYKFRGKKAIEILILSPIIVPTVAVAMGIHVTFIKLGLANTFMGVVLVHIIPCIPYGVKILKDTFELLGESMEVQAKVLGASSFQTFTNITLPLISPGLIVSSSLVFIVSFSQYFLTFLIGGGKVVTFSMVMFPYIQSGDRTIASVYSIVFIITTLILLYLIERFLRHYYEDKMKLNSDGIFLSN
ncbi:ABC-type spermidine/putrescine transport system, permease component II [Gottschalkia purinilytica]|uniref:ABC-type spermidine/putrescine transport system, permease component II n=1 Tax=Gottschalkia purinilytica TaxID=1503 RepID=A0A0L0W6W7_GOTPU|nr:ABC transporter permease subunit [Gottschalkia purinilytica]KNF07259.1 ABC-type spermidine/putrescine transport system, permease component II [Gottschalkia purinilytica]